MQVRNSFILSSLKAPSSSPAGQTVLSRCGAVAHAFTGQDMLVKGVPGCAVSIQRVSDVLHPYNSVQSADRTNTGTNVTPA